MRGKQPPDVQYYVLENDSPDKDTHLECFKNMRSRMFSTYFSHMCNVSTHIINQLNKPNFDRIITFADLRHHPFVDVSEEFLRSDIEVVNFTHSCITGVNRSDGKPLYFKLFNQLPGSSKRGNFVLIDSSYLHIWEESLPTYSVVFSSEELGKPITFSSTNGQFSLLQVVSSCVGTLRDLEESNNMHLDCRLPNFVFSLNQDNLTCDLIDFELMVALSNSGNHAKFRLFAPSSQVPPRLRTKNTFCGPVTVSFLEDYYVFLYSLLHRLYRLFKKPFPECTHYDSLTSLIEGLKDDIGDVCGNLLKLLVPKELDDIGVQDCCSERVFTDFNHRLDVFLSESSSVSCDQQEVFGDLTEVSLMKTTSGVRLSYK
ncbi:hypothetical protein GEMRC1_013874 [Eukaryota sp. GEM-RC1]